MPDDKSKRGKADRARVDPGADYEIDVLRKKYPSIPRAEIERVARLAPHNKRDWIEQELDRLMKGK